MKSVGIRSWRLSYLQGKLLHLQGEGTHVFKAEENHIYTKLDILLK